MALDLAITLILVGFIFILTVLIFKNYMAAILYDLVDMVLSFVDEPFGGAVMFDWGDWIAALLIFVKERKVSSNVVAFLVAVEAANFIPVFDYVTNFIPSVLISRILFAKYHMAQMKQQELKKEIQYAQVHGIAVTHAKHQLKKMHALINDSPIDAINMEEKELKKLLEGEIRGNTNKVEDKLNHLIRLINDQGYLDDGIVRKAQGMVNKIREEMEKARNALQTNDGEQLEAAKATMIELDKFLGEEMKEMEHDFREALKGAPKMRSVWQRVR